MLKNLQSELQSFGKYVVQQSRSNLTKKNHNVDKRLYRSLDYKISESNDKYSLQFLMEDYGMFLDKGVKGANPSLVKNGKQKGSNSPYSFKFKKLKNKKNGLIYGAGDAGRQLLSSLENNLEMKVVGFLDDNKQFHNQTILGQTVFDPLKIIELNNLKNIDFIKFEFII